jgi:preprotein translocase subunit YajC
MGLIVLLVTFGLMWALFILPQQRRVKQHTALVRSLDPGDEVVTAGGVIGTIVEIVDDIVTIRVTDDVELRILRGAISRRMDDGAIEPLDEADADELEDLDEQGLAPGPAENGDGNGEAWPRATRDEPGDHGDDPARERS